MHYHQLTAKDFVPPVEGVTDLPILEDVIGFYGYGHLDPATFINAINALEIKLGVFDEDEITQKGYSVDRVKHIWARGAAMNEDDDWSLDTLDEYCGQLNADSPHVAPLTEVQFS